MQASKYWMEFSGSLPQPANTDEPFPMSESDNKLIAWLFKITARNSTPSCASRSCEAKTGDESASVQKETRDDWQTVACICGYDAEAFAEAGVEIPLTAAEIDHFRRNHRGIDNSVNRDFISVRSDLPSPLSELYGLYKHRSRIDAEATLFVAQATGSTRIARAMSDLLAIGGFACGLECVSHMAMTYSVPAAFDTSDIIDRTSHEAERRLALPIDHPAHLLKLSPDEINVLASNIVERSLMPASLFLEKANLLAEARQDVNRLPFSKQFVTAVGEGDLSLKSPWVARICLAYSNVVGEWIAGQPEIKQAAVISDQ